MAAHLSKSEIVAELVAQGVGDKRHISHMLEALAALAADEIADGNDFVIPGVVKIQYRYKSAQKKGERYKKGDTVKGPQGERIAEEDSPARKASVKLVAAPYGAVAKLKPGNAEGQAEFLKTKTGKSVAKRKG